MNEEHNISLLVTREYPQLDQPAILAHIVREFEKDWADWLPPRILSAGSPVRMAARKGLAK